MSAITITQSSPKISATQVAVTVNVQPGVVVDSGGGGPITTDDIEDMSDAGQALAIAADPAEQRTLLELSLTFSPGLLQFGAAGVTQTIAPYNSSGTNVDGTNLYLGPGRNTGEGEPGIVKIRVGSFGASGTSLRPLVDSMTFSNGRTASEFPLTLPEVAAGDSALYNGAWARDVVTGGLLVAIENVWTAVGGGSPDGSSGQAQYNSGGAFAGAANEIYDATTAALKYSSASYTAGTTLPGALVKTIAEQGSHSGNQSAFSLHHAYNPTAPVDVWSLVAKSGTVGGQSVALSLGNEYESYNLGLKSLGINFVDCGVSMRQLSSNRLEVRTANATGSELIVDDGDTDCGYLFSGARGFVVFCDYQGTELLKISRGIGGARVRGAGASSVPLTVQLAASQTGDAMQVKDSSSAVVAKVAANGDLTARTLTSNVFTVATLPSGSVAQRAFVSDELTATFRSTATGGGSIECPVFYGNGSWRVG